MVNGANSVMLSVITDNTARQEAVDASYIFNLVRAICERRVQWLDHILRIDEERILQCAVKEVYENKSEGDIMMDAPKPDSWREMELWSVDRDKWRSRV